MFRQLLSTHIFDMVYITIRNKWLVLTEYVLELKKTKYFFTGRTIIPYRNSVCTPTLHYGKEHCNGLYIKASEIYNLLKKLYC